MVGSSEFSTSKVPLNDGIIAWDIRETSNLWNFAYYLDLMKLLFKYRPNLVIILGLLNILPVTIYSLLSWKSVYVPVFVGEFSYHGTKKVNQFLMALGFRLLGTSLQLSQKKIHSAFTLATYTRERIDKLAPNLSGKIKLISYPISRALSHP